MADAGCSALLGLAARKLRRVTVPLASAASAELNGNELVDGDLARSLTSRSTRRGPIVATLASAAHVK